jgi:hypothetical protein
VQGLDDNESYTESFTYTVDDGDATDTETITITITGDNDAPTLTTMTTFSDSGAYDWGTEENTPITISYAMLAANGNEADVDGDTIVFRITSVTSGTLTKDGDPVVDGTTMIGSGESLVWTPAAGSNGSGVNAFKVEAWDGDEASASPVQVKIDVLAQASEFEVNLVTDSLAIPNFDVDDMVVITGVSAADVGYATGSGNTTVSYTDVGSGDDLDTLVITGFTGNPDGTNILFSNGSVLKVGSGTLVGTSAANGDQLIADNSGVVMRGGGGNDVLRGGSGTDTFFGGTGADKLYTTTDGAQDLFLYTAKVGSLNDGSDMVYGFGIGQDLIKLTDVSSAQLTANFSTYVTSIAETSGNTLITLADGNTITLMGITTGIDSSDFIGYA